jgi:hypothetical protein
MHAPPPHPLRTLSKIQELVTIGTCISRITVHICAIHDKKRAINVKIPITLYTLLNIFASNKSCFEPLPQAGGGGGPVLC